MNNLSTKTEDKSASYRVGIDIGGTFTDFVIYDTVSQTIRLEKITTTPNNLWLAIDNGLQQSKISLTEISQLAHGTTIGLNTLLERRGAATGLITTMGFRDSYEIARGARPDSYNLFYRKPEALVPREHRIEVCERIDSTGQIVTPMEEDDVIAAAKHFRNHNIASIAVCFLHSYRNPEHERRAAAILTEYLPEAQVSTSSSLVREWREYERTSTTCINAYIMPPTAMYMEHMTAALEQSGYRRPFFVNQSAGGVQSVEAATAKPVTTLISGPAGGVVAAARTGILAGFRNVISFDMGGTSTDVSVIHDGQPTITANATVAHQPVMIPMVDLHSIGAGGGSLAALDSVNALNVGPQSSGAEPGPVCYGRGGLQPTVTDANLVLGRVAPTLFLPGKMHLDEQKAREAIETAVGQPLGLSPEEAAAGIIDIVNLKMSMAVRKITVQRGLDPKDFVLFAFGGAGPMHACWIAQELNIPKVVIPMAPGQFSALGILFSDIRHDFVRTAPAGHTSFSSSLLGSLFQDVSIEAREKLSDEDVESTNIELQKSVDIRYVGQEYTVNVPVQSSKITEKIVLDIQKTFHALHQRLYSHASPEEPIELVNVRIAAIGRMSEVGLPIIEAGGTSPPSQAYAGEVQIYFDDTNGYIPCKVWGRRNLLAGNNIEGPAMIADLGATTILPPKLTCQIDQHGLLVIDIPAIHK